MDLFDLLLISLRTLGKNKLRSGLTVRSRYSPET